MVAAVKPGIKVAGWRRFSVPPLKFKREVLVASHPNIVRRDRAAQQVGRANRGVAAKAKLKRGHRSS